MIGLDYDNLREKLSDLKELNIYLPLLLSSYIHPDYLDKLDDKEKEKYYQHRVELMGAEDYSLYLEEEMLEFIDKYPQFQDIIVK